LSGVDTALFLYVALTMLVEARRDGRLIVGGLAAVMLLGFAAKLGYEVTTGSAIFVEGQQGEFVVLPLAHLVGAALGGAVALVESTRNRGDLRRSLAGGRASAAGSRTVMAQIAPTSAA
jgi:hypothetical protein